MDWSREGEGEFGVWIRRVSGGEKVADGAGIGDGLGDYGNAVEGEASWSYTMGGNKTTGRLVADHSVEA